MAPVPGTGGGFLTGELVKGFRLLRIPVATGSPIARGLLVKRHESRDPSEAAQTGRTLFVSHLDNFVTEAQLQRCFGDAFGAVEKVELKSVEKRGQRADQRADNVRTFVNFARVVFQSADSLSKALAAANGRMASTAVLPLPGATLKEQVKARKTLYREPGELRQEIDAWMANFDAAQDEKRRLLRESAQVDEDGFTKVVSGVTQTTDGFSIRSAQRPALKTGAFLESVRGTRDPETNQIRDTKRKKKKKERERPDFYKFQLREKRREEIIDHRKRVVEDTEKVMHMKKQKKFKIGKAGKDAAK